MTTEFAAAIAIFRELGWADAAPADAERLPIGSREQRRTAVLGLRSGTWGSRPGVDAAMLALFAVRAGITASRATQILPPGADADLVTRIVAGRGPAFAAQFVDHACRSARRPQASWPTPHGGVAVRLVLRGVVPAPPDAEYLHDWAVCAADAACAADEADAQARVRYGLDATTGVDPREIAPTYAECARAAAAAALPAAAGLARSLPAAVARGWIARADALEVGVRALDAAQRPADRAAWAALLRQDLAMGDDEVLARADALTAAVALGGPPVVEAFGPALIAGVDDRTLVDVATVGFAVTTNRARGALLRALRSRPRPADEVLPAVVDALAELSDSTDAGIRRDLARILAAWRVEAPPPPSRQAPERRGLWRPTPPVWDVPALELPAPTPDALIDAAAVLTGRPEDVVDLDLERFLHLANAVAWADPAVARAALRGVRRGGAAGLRSVPAWVEHDAHAPLRDTPAARWASTAVVYIHGPVVAREAAVFQRLGLVPCLLSTPTWADLRIGVADLIERLSRYALAGATASEGDLYLAMTRTDPSDAGPRDVAALTASNVPVVTQDGALLSIGAGEVLARYLVRPIAEPGLERDAARGVWRPRELSLPDALSGLPPRLQAGLARHDPHAASFPGWGDAALCQSATGDTAAAGPTLRQWSRRATPFGPGGAVNLIAAQREPHPAAAADVAEAVDEAWRRGLLRPGVADIRYLDWRTEPSSLAALARACAGLAERGMLSVVWPVLADVAAAAAEAQRMPAGTAEVVEALGGLLPAVEAAVADGLAEPDALAVPGLRALAVRSGSSRAVTLAREVAARLPPAAPSTAASPSEPVRAAPDMDALWPAGAGEVPAVVDDAVVSAQWSAIRTAPVVELALPSAPGMTFRPTDLGLGEVERSGRLPVLRIAPDGDVDAVVLLRWDPRRRKLEAETPAADRRGLARWLPQRPEPAPVITSSMVVAVLAALCGEGAPTHAARSLATGGRVGSAAVTVAMRVLLRLPDANPARIARVIEKEPSTLPVLWPVLVEAVASAAAAAGAPPAWAGRILDTALHHAAVLGEAARRGLIPPESAAWPGLRRLAERPEASATVRDKAQRLIAALA